MFYFEKSPKDLFFVEKKFKKTKRLISFFLQIKSKKGCVFMDLIDLVTLSHRFIKYFSFAPQVLV